MSKIDIHIYGVHERDAMIAATVEKLGLSNDNVHYDDRPGGGLMVYTAKKAWLAPVPEGVTHRVALADDVEVCEDFWKICEQIAEAHPDAIVSFFPYEFMERNPEVEGRDTPYFQTSILSGCAVMLPVEYIQPCFDYIKAVFDDNCADDEGIQAWADARGMRVLTTIPAIIQHIGDDSIANKGCFIRRTVYYDPKPAANWGSREVLKYTEHEWFFSNRGKRRTKRGVVSYVS